MKKSLSIILFLLSACTALSAQDIIHVFNSPEIKAKVLEINERDILYKDYHNLDGPDYRISRSRVSFIDFENGSRQVFNQVNPYGAGPYSGPGLYDDYYGLDYRWGGYYYRDRRLSGEDLADYIGISLYGGDYRRARNQYYWGVAVTGVGVMALVSSVVGHIGTNNYNNFSDDPFFTDLSTSGFIAGYVAGAACLGVGIPLWASGSRKLSRIADDYNRNYGRRNLGYSSTLSVGPTRSGLGFALNF